MSEQEQPRYQVSLINPTRLHTLLNAWAQEAAQLGLYEQFRESLLSAHQLLGQEPLTWGDPLYHAGNAQFQVCRGIRDLVIVHYAVHEKARAVWVADIRPVPNRGFSDDPLAAPES